MNNDMNMKIGVAVFAVLLLIVIAVIIFVKKDNYQYPTGQLYSPSSGQPGANQKGNGGLTIQPGSYAALVADQNGNISTSAAVPIGGIIMWAGTINNIPTGWGLCNGATYETLISPDLTGKFVLGAGPSNSPYTPSYGVGDTGGEDYHQLTTSEIPSHTHAVNIPGSSSGSGTGTGWSITVGETGSTGGDSANKDSSGNPLTLPHNNMPPYYALAYIIKYT